MRLAIGRVLLLAAMLPLLAACDPSGPAEPGSADVNVQLKADGDADVELLLPAERNGLSPLKLGAQVGEALFPKTESRRVSVDDQGGKGYPLVRIRVKSAYSPGSRPRLAFDVGGAVRALSDEGLTSVQVVINAPVVPAAAQWSVQPDDQSNGYWSWHALSPTKPAPSGEVTLDPRPSRAFVAILLLAVTVGALVAGLFALRARRRWTGVLLGTTAFATSLRAVARAGAVQGDNLGVAGYLSGTTLHVVTLLPLAALLGLPLGITVVVLAFTRRATPTESVAA